MTLIPPPSTSLASFHASKIGAGRVLLFCLIFFGLAVTEEVSNQLLPLTLHRLTGSAAAIGAILALNPLFGFIAQPLVGWWSDRVWTRFGRRATFLIVAAPIVALCHVAIPSVGELWKVVMIVIVYQFCQDILWGSDHPLLADLFPSKMRGLIAGLLSMSYQLGNVFVTRYGLKLVDAHEKAHGGEHFGAPLYYWAAFFQVTLVMGLAFFLWEKPRPAGSSAGRMTPRIYLRDFASQPGLLRAAWINFGLAFQVTAATGFLVLFGTVTLGASKSDYAQAMGWLPMIGFAYVGLIGLAADRFSRRRLLMIGFAGCAGGYVLGWQAQSLTMLAVAFLVFKFFTSTVELTYKAFITDFYPTNKIGQLAGAVNVFYATGRTISYVLVGAVVAACGNDYRLVWLVAIVVALANLAMMFTVREPQPDKPEPVK